MSIHVFYPSPEMPDQIVAYAEGLQLHKKEFGDVTGNAPADLKPLVSEARRLQPMAAEIQHLRLQLAARLDAYHKAAAPLWQHFPERLEYARTDAEKHDKVALRNFLLAFRHNGGRHVAKTAANHGAAVTAKPGTVA